jgi:hypothetical protein
MNNKYCNRLSSKIYHAYIDQHIQSVRHDLRGEIVGDLRFLDNNRSDRVRVQGDDPRRASDEEIDEP